MVENSAGENIKTTQVQSVPAGFWCRSAGTVDFKETFAFKISTQPLNVEVKEVSGVPKRLASLSIEPQDLQDLAEWSRTQWRRSWPKEREDALIGKQFDMCRSFDAEDEKEKVNRMWEVGFKPHKLSAGGYVWLAVCNVKKESIGVLC